MCLTLGVLEAEKLQKHRWLKCCGTPCIFIKFLDKVLNLSFSNAFGQITPPVFSAHFYVLFFSFC